MLDLLNVKEGAGELRVSVFNLRRMIWAKRLPYVRLGRRILLRRQDLENFVSQNVVEADPQGYRSSF